MTVAVGARKRGGKLPSDATSFFGRRDEITELKRLLSAARVVTLTGPGGVGKTRLALRTAETVRRGFHNNVWFVELDELRDPSLLARTVADKLDLHDQSARPAIDIVIDGIKDGPLLLVLDNCEHLVDECAEFVTTLLRNCPELTVMATSRQSLGMLGENTFPVAPFQVPDPDDSLSPESIGHYDAVRLFAERASRVVQGFHIDTQNYRTIARICQDLDGIPLSIELTAARLRSLSLEQIVERLDERFRLLGGGPRAAPERQRTLRALIDWSYELCSEHERRVWARASVFSGSFGLDAIEHVAGNGDVEPSEVLDIVGSLVDKSLLIRDEGDTAVRYRILETIRDYGEQRLVEAGELLAIRRRHRDWYAQLGARFEAEFIGPDEVGWVHRLRLEHPNLRVALDFCAQQPGEAEVGLRLATRLEDYWAIRGLYTELRHWLNRTLPTAQPTHERVSGLRMNGWYAMLQGDIAVAQQLLTEANELNRELGDESEAAYLKTVSGAATLFTGQVSIAAKQLSEAVAGFRAAGVLRGELISLFLLGLARGLNAEAEAGLAVLNECIERSSQLGEVGWRSWAQWAVTQIEIPYGTLDRAEAAAKKALELQQMLEIRLGMALSIDTLACIAERRDHHTRAAELFGAASVLWHMVGASPGSYVGIDEHHRRHTELARRALGDAAYEAAYTRGSQLAIDQAVDLALETKRAEAKPAEPTPAETPLTRREQQIAELVAEGLTNRDIAARLIISQRTAEAHVEHILTKLGFSSRTQIATWIAGQQ